ncbi:ArsR family transcriptional regulator [Arthrobacter oryzae]|uniref:ArsR/SmtB family transcription factor n=1 Tax=Arthrobacter TaxID=1663 RepID=UPI001F00496A|nr:MULTISPECIES: metalloregulator ArsR/SmtB family transcription factor [Arthrobacter]MDP9989360.1 ArsR family transcriptional regulator [Arthrobacter oryzae]UKA71467.1 metalloregulator ArsR/SmtB family transcription factor [Arthrobacter sp. FW306-06-A]
MEEFSDFRAPLYEVKANLFKGLAHPVRIRVLELLSAAPEVPVIDMLAATGLEASHLSQHLAVLRRYHLIKGERRALQMFYSLTYPQVAELLAVAKQLLTDILGDTREQLEQAAADTAKAGQPTQ